MPVVAVVVMPVVAVAVMEVAVAVMEVAVAGTEVALVEQQGVLCLFLYRLFLYCLLVDLCPCEVL